MSIFDNYLYLTKPSKKWHAILRRGDSIQPAPRHCFVVMEAGLRNEHPVGFAPTPVDSSDPPRPVHEM